MKYVTGSSSLWWEVRILLAYLLRILSGLIRKKYMHQQKNSPSFYQHLHNVLTSDLVFLTRQVSDVIMNTQGDLLLGIYYKEHMAPKNNGLKICLTSTWLPLWIKPKCLSLADAGVSFCWLKLKGNPILSLPKQKALARFSD